MMDRMPAACASAAGDDLSAAFFWRVGIPLLAGVGLLLARADHDAFTWPAIDNLPGLMHAMDPGFPQGDFFGSASAADPGGRSPFLLLLRLLSRGEDPYTGLYLAKTLTCAAIFPAAAAWVRTLAGQVCGSGPLVSLLALLAPVLAWAGCASLFTWAWWKPLWTEATPHAAAMAVGMFAVCLPTVGRAGWLRSLLLGSSILLHPVIGAAHAGIALGLPLVRLGWRQGWHHLVRAAWSWCTLLALAAGMGYHRLLGGSLPGERILEIYVLQFHPGHYRPWSWTAGTLGPWWAHALFSLGMAGCAAMGTPRSSRAWTLAGCSALVVAAASAGQWLANATHIGALLLLGPSRLVVLLYWLIAAQFAAAAQGALGRMRWVGNLGGFLHHLAPPRSWSFAIFTCLLAAILLHGTRPDDYRGRIRAADPAFWEFVQSTDPEAVFCVHQSPLRARIPIIARRAVVAGSGFPFALRHWEAASRRGLVIGLDPRCEVRDPYLRTVIGYDRLPPRHFIQAGQEVRIDYVLRSWDAPADDWKRMVPAFSSAVSRVHVYRLADLESASTDQDP